VERIPDVFSAVEKGKAEFGVAPVENRYFFFCITLGLEFSGTKVCEP